MLKPGSLFAQKGSTHCCPQDITLVFVYVYIYVYMYIYHFAEVGSQKRENKSDTTIQLQQKELHYMNT